METVFELRNVSFDYEGIPAIRSLSLDIRRGERVALVGANGCGKSTLLHLMDGLYFALAGSIAFCGKEISRNSLKDKSFSASFRQRVSMVFQNPEVQLFNSTVFDEVAFGPLRLELPKEEIRHRIDEVLEFMGISSLRDRPPFRLSGGEKKKVALASALVMKPEVLLLDEPTAALDPRSQSQLVDLLQRWKGSDTTVVTATHQTELLEDIADIVHVMQAGQILTTSTPERILGDTHLLLEANLIHAHRHTHGTVTHSHPHHPGKHTHGSH